MCVCVRAFMMRMSVMIALLTGSVPAMPRKGAWVVFLNYNGWGKLSPLMQVKVDDEGVPYLDWERAIPLSFVDHPTVMTERSPAVRKLIIDMRLAVDNREKKPIQPKEFDASATLETNVAYRRIYDRPLVSMAASVERQTQPRLIHGPVLVDVAGK
eukprot:GHVU01129316.1.p1 GENE.GHVU01129316.1~~GHVU01129316.1.p1  ORF type:complete len:156 (-),score=16.91 GHVU01129316.1:4358-4825(-)